MHPIAYAYTFAHISISSDLGMPHVSFSLSSRLKVFHFRQETLYICHEICIWFILDVFDNTLPICQLYFTCPKEAYNCPVPMRANEITMEDMGKDTPELLLPGGVAKTE